MKQPSSLIAGERIGTLLFVDAVSFVIAFAAMVGIRYSDSLAASIYGHLGSFSLLLGVWLCIGYLFGLYDLRVLKNSYDLTTTIFTSTAFSLIVTVIVFYFIPLGITPKTNLGLFGVFFFLLDAAVRIFLHLHFQRPLHRVFILSSPDEADELRRLFLSSPHLGYQIIRHCSNESETVLSQISDMIRDKKVDTIITKRSLMDQSSSTVIDEKFGKNVICHDLAYVYEVLFKKVLPCEGEKYYFITRFRVDIDSVYERLRGLIERCIALVFFAVSAPLIGIISLCILIASGHPVFYVQIRVGRHGKFFRLWKFRTMIRNAEPVGPRWSSGEFDQRITKIGFFLRRTHLDELPQLINILKGEMSFVGPRPERLQFVERLRREIPLYDYRHTVLPGMTGWAQVNYPYGSSVNDAREKLMFDLYYIKKRSFILDALIVLRSLPLLFMKRVSRI